MPVHGSCHCGATRFSLTHAPTQLSTCNCTFCTKRGGLWCYLGHDEFTLETSDPDTVYLWSSKTVTHHFCATCGCGTYFTAPTWTDLKPDFSHMRIGVNARLLNDVDLTALPVRHVDGRHQW